MSLCRHSRNHLNQFFRLSWYLLTNPEAEDHDEDLELPTLEQEETTAPVQGSPSKKQKTGKKKKKKKPDDNDASPEHSPRNEPASSSNFNL